MRSTFSILFYLKRNMPGKDGRVPVMGRITINGGISQFSLKISINPKYWDAGANRMKGRSDEAEKINERLESVRAAVARHYYSILDREGYVSALQVKNAYLGLNIRQEGLLQLFRMHNETFLRQVGRGRSRNTYIKYRSVYNHLSAFIRAHYRSQDMPLRELDVSFIREFDLYLRNEKQCSINTIWIYMMPLKRMITMARNRGLLLTNPFAEYKVTPESSDRGFLSMEEIERLMTVGLDKPHLVLARDLFIFSCFTGLSYADVRNLTAGHLQISFDGHLWITIRRQKTNIASNIRLLDIPRTIIEKYMDPSSNGRIFPIPSNAQCNVNLKKIAEIAGIKAHMTFHLARHTFATTITLSQGVPIETVSRMLGHMNIKTTQIYARITNQKVSQDMELLSSKLEGMNHLLKKCNPPFKI